MMEDIFGLICIALVVVAAALAAFIVFEFFNNLNK